MELTEVQGLIRGGPLGDSGGTGHSPRKVPLEQALNAQGLVGVLSQSGEDWERGGGEGAWSRSGLPRAPGPPRLTAAARLRF